MFERFTQGARRAVMLAQEEARSLGHSHVGTEHLLLGLVHDSSGVSAAILGAAGVTLEAARDAVAEIAGRGEQPPAVPVPFTARARKVLELSLREALELRQGYISTEHLLLGLIREGSGAGAQILERLAGPLPDLRQQVMKAARAAPPQPADDEFAAISSWYTGSSVPRAASGSRPAQPPVPPRLVVELRQLLKSVDRRLAGIERRLGLPAGQLAAEDAADRPDEPDLWPDEPAAGTAETGTAETGASGPGTAETGASGPGAE